MKPKIVHKQGVLCLLSFLVCTTLCAQTLPVKQWEKTYGKANADDLFESGEQTADGGYIFGGYIYSSSRGSDYWVIKVDAAGNKQWEKIFGGTADDNIRSLQQTADGGYILGGTSASGKSSDKTAAGKGNDDY